MFDDGYSNYPTLEKLITLKIQLPINKDGEIDFEFMESFVAELEAERVAELEAYLAAASLKDYELTTTELSALNQFPNLTWGEFKISDLFKVNSSKKRFDANKIQILNDGYPYIVRTALNNGVKGYLKENPEFLNDGNTISFGQDTATIFYQEKPYFTGDKIKILKPLNKHFSKSNSMFFIASINQAFQTFSWGSKFDIKIINNSKIQFPINSAGEIDFEFMNDFIKAIEKLVIKDVVIYAERKIQATKGVISSNI